MAKKDDFDWRLRQLSTQGRLHLHHSPDYYLELYRHAPVGYLLLDRGFRISEINHTGTDMLGVPGHQAVGRFLADFVAPSHREALTLTLREAFAGGGSRSCELLPAAGKRARFLHLTACPGEGDRAGGGSAAGLRPATNAEEEHREPGPSRQPLMATLTDITDRKLLELDLERRIRDLEREAAVRTRELETVTRKLADSEQRYRTMAERSLEGILIVRRGRVLFANQPAARLLGAGSPENLVGADTADLVEPVSRRHARSLVTLSSCGVARTELAVRRIDGGVIEVEAAAAPVLYQGYRAVQAVFREITDRKRLEREVSRYQRRLRRLAAQISSVADRERRQLAGNIHDTVGQLLGLVQIKLDMLRGEGLHGDAEDLVDELKIIVESAIEQTRNLTYELSPPVLRQLGLDAALEWLAETCARRYGFVCRVRDDGKPKPIPDDLKMFLYQSVRELVHNAAKHAAPRLVTVTSTRLNGSVKITVEDDGSGFDTGALAVQMEIHGGYGLFAIRVRLEEWGGHLLIDSEPGEGTAVTMIAPL
ncbi:MAG: PAS domain-containing sensor histidine kinase [Spirochaetota bacterium]